MTNQRDNENVEHQESSSGGEAGNSNYKWPSLENIGHILGAAFIITYSAGLVMHNAYLYVFGVSDFGLLKPRYIFTGVLAGIGSSSAYLLIVGCQIVIRQIRQIRPGQVKSALIFKFACCAVLAAVPCRLIYRFADFLKLDFETAVALCITAMLPGVIVKLIIDLAWGGRRLEIKSRALGLRVGEGEGVFVLQKIGPILFLILIFPIASLAFLGLMALTVLPRVPPSLGGMKPAVVVVILQKEAVPAATDLGIPTNASGKILPKTFLVYEAEDFILIAVSGPKAEPKKIVRFTSGQVAGWTVQERSGRREFSVSII
ncbi:hypothetical protein AB0C69_26970 [Actinomadura sp. NPDC048032]|uniref:hypothetical protein n=1 Tax=Actinomadura sp. NPDC048032 TaxID=3155747 RepID=UPI00340D8C07